LDRGFNICPDFRIILREQKTIGAGRDGPTAYKGAPEDFRVYRSGAPNRKTFKKWCGEYKIGRMIDLAGNAEKHELKFQKEGICTNIDIIQIDHIDKKQDPKKPVSENFLKNFDEQVTKAKKDGVGLLFRCTLGSHRTGRLAAYYRMKYQHMKPEDAID
jgi:protein tyrosine/serine phosphatase